MRPHELHRQGRYLGGFLLYLIQETPLTGGGLLDDGHQKLRDAQISLRCAQCLDEKTISNYMQKLNDNPELQQIVIDLLKPFLDRFTEVDKILLSDKPTATKQTDALKILDLKTCKKNAHPTIDLEYAHLVYDISRNENLTELESKRMAVSILKDKYMFNSNASTITMIRRSRNSFKRRYGFNYGLAPPAPWESS